MDLEMFGFGDRCEIVNRKGEQVVVSEYSLHVQCAWRIVGREGIVVGSLNRWYPAQEDSDWQAFDEEKDLARLESCMNAWIGSHVSAPLRVTEILADDLGGFELVLNDSYRLQVFPCHSLTGENSEYWRLFRRSDENSHFVVTGYGIEE